MLLILLVLSDCSGADSDSAPNDSEQALAPTGQPKEVPNAEEDRVATTQPSASGLADNEGQEKVSGSIRPDYKKALVSLRSRTTSPIQIRDRWPSEYLVGQSLIRIRDATVESIDDGTGETQWRTESEHGLKLRWLGHHRGILFFSEVGSSNRKDDEEAASTSNIPRLTLKSGSWMKPLTLPLDAGERAGINNVTSFLADEDSVFILNHTMKSDFPTNKHVGHRLTRFAVDSSDLVWSKYYESAGTIQPPGAFIIGGSRGPARDGQAIQNLAKLGSKVLLCAGPLEDIAAIDPVDGETVWGVPRLWEFRRGFIGPSVWQHFLGRYGVRKGELDLAALTLAELREKNKNKDGGFFADEDYVEELKQKVKVLKEQVERQPGSIVAGPVVVTSPDNKHKLRIFVAAATSASHEWPGFLSDCIIYELNDAGNVIGTLTLPRFVRGSNYTTIDHTVVWRCEAGGNARLFPSAERGNRDLIVNLEWRRDREDGDEKVWFQNGSWNDSVVFTGNSMIRVLNGGYIDAQESQEYRFRFAVTDLVTGSMDAFTLSVPFSGEISIPTKNYSHRTDKNGRQTWVSFSSLPIALSALEIRGNKLVFSLKTETGVCSLEFKLSSLLAVSGTGE